MQHGSISAHKKNVVLSLCTSSFTHLHCFEIIFLGINSAETIIDFVFPAPFVCCSPSLFACPLSVKKFVNLQLFQKCSECSSGCSVSMEHRSFYITQKCHQCCISKEWRSHPSEQILRDPVVRFKNQEVGAGCG